MTNDYKQIKNILNFIDSACLRIDLGWIITYANPQCSFLLGTSPEELIGKDLRETLPDVVSMFYKPLRHTLTSHESQHAEAIFGPTNKYLELFVNFYEDGILAVFRDITNRRHNEQLVQDASIRYRAIFDTVADALIIINNKGEITSFNAASERIFGYEAEEIIGHDISILLPENERQEHKGYIADSQIYESRIINRSRDLEGVRKDGTIFPLELNIAPMFLDNERGFIGILRDITERKKSEAEIMASKEKVEKASQAKTEFLRSMSHELRTPLNAILGFGQLLELQKGDISEKDTQEFINDIMQAGHNLLDLVNQVLNLSRIDTGQLHMQLEPVLLHNVVTE
ncbi:MAG: PAS domain S-box protein, partial [Gammaproteobacteria bacterium]|nr:PAS domain S-box protein [Gammaproteobacteria bacterium]